MKEKMLNAIFIIIGLLIAGYFYKKYRIAPKFDMQNYSLTDLDGNKVSLPELTKNKNAFINFWGTWCYQCVGEMPALVQLSEELKSNNFVFITISDEPIEKLKNFQEKKQLPFIMLHSEKPFSEYKIFTVPTTYILDKKGNLAKTQVGLHNWLDMSVKKELQNL